VLLLTACAAHPPPSLVVVVSLDTLRADRLGAYGSAAGLTPNLDRFAAEGVVFTRAWAQANETLYSHASLFTSRHASEVSALDGHFQYPAGRTSLAAAFRAAGWATAGFVAGGELSASFGLDDGFVTWDDGASFGSLCQTGPAAIRWLDARVRRQPILLFVHGYDTHDRYLKPPPLGYAEADPTYAGLGATIARKTGESSNVVGGRWSEGGARIEALSLLHPRFDRGAAIAETDPDAPTLTAEDVAHLRGVYDGAVGWADACFGLFMAGLGRRLDEAVVVVLSDHGEELGEHGVFHHRYSLGDEVLAVPLIIRSPGNGAGRVDGPVDLLDVAPTILELAGLPPLPGAEGVSLAGTLGGEAWEGREVSLAEGRLRLRSVRAGSARLTFEGFNAGDPTAEATLRQAPADGTWLTLEGDQGELDRLRTALAEHGGGR
jgi:arylsulfatase